MPYKDPEVARQKNRERYLAKREQILAQTKKYYETHKEAQKQTRREWQLNHPEKMLEYSRNWTAANPEKKKQFGREYKQRLRDQVFDHYGRYCKCCGEDHEEFLTMDHVHGGGNKHRREAKITNSADLFLWIIRHNFPPDFRTLCYNCNCARGFLGYCPHEREPEYGIQPAC